MNVRSRTAGSFLAFLTLSSVGLAAESDLSGIWQIAWTLRGLPGYSRMTLTARGEGWDAVLAGRSARLAILRQGDEVQLTCKEGGKDCGVLTGHFDGGVLKASGGFLGSQEAVFTARRQPAPPSGRTRHEFVPTGFHHTFSSSIQPALVIRSGDTVHTTTVDAAGVDERGVFRTPPGNPLTGPFAIEGAWPGDTVAIKFDRIRLNRPSAVANSSSVTLSALSPPYVRQYKRVAGFDSTWKLDLERGIGMLANPTERMKNYTVALKPMLGCVGVAPQGEAAFGSSSLGPYGGNLDYNRIVEGTTVYLRVNHAGALLFIGDAHAAQGDGELMTTALETTADVEFTVELQESGRGIQEPRAEDAEYLMVMGPGRSLENSLQLATTGMARWLEQEYGLDSAEIAMVLGSSMHYDIARSADHIVARLAKRTLQQLPPVSGAK